jgi:hypothetical protein
MALSIFTLSLKRDLLILSGKMLPYVIAQDFR